jgi:hypothetical protein
MTVDGRPERAAVAGFGLDLPAELTFHPLGARQLDPNEPDGYPTSDPTSGFTPSYEGFAGIIYGQSGPDTLRLFCIDLHTSTWGGIGYVLGDWTDADVPHVGYVARVLNEYYPNTNEPSALAEKTTRPPRSRPRSGSSATATSSPRATRFTIRSRRSQRRSSRPGRSLSRRRRA